MIKLSVNIRDEFRFSEAHESMNAAGSVQSTGVTYFARHPLRSYFHEHQKKGIYFLRKRFPIFSDVHGSMNAIGYVQST